MKREILGCGVILIEMWERLSLRTRLLLPLGLMFVAALLAGGVSLQIFATAQLMEETEPTARSAKAVAAALNGALRSSTHPQATLEAFAKDPKSFDLRDPIFQHLGHCSPCSQFVRDHRVR